MSHWESTDRPFPCDQESSPANTGRETPDPVPHGRDFPCMVFTPSIRELLSPVAWDVMRELHMEDVLRVSFGKRSPTLPRPIARRHTAFTTHREGIQDLSIPSWDHARSYPGNDHPRPAAAVPAPHGFTSATPANVHVRRQPAWRPPHGRLLPLSPDRARCIYSGVFRLRDVE